MTGPDTRDRAPRRPLPRPTLSDVLRGSERTLFLRDLGFAVAASRLVPRLYRPGILRRLGVAVGAARLNAGGFYGGTRLTIGDRSFINHGVFFDCTAQITIEEDVSVGMQVTFITSTHSIGTSERRAGTAEEGAIRVCSGSWIGARATVLPGVTIGAGCVIAAGALVTGDCEPGVVYAGVPARPLRRLDGA